MVPVRYPQSLIERIKMCLAKHETHSDLTRQYWEKECSTRELDAKEKSNDLAKRHKKLAKKVAKKRSNRVEK